MKNKFFRRYLSSKVLPIWMILLIDIFLIIVSCLFAYILRHNFGMLFENSALVGKTILWATMINLIFFRVFKTYSNVLRFSSIVDIMRIFIALAVSYGVLIMIGFFFEGQSGPMFVETSVLIIAFVVNTALMTCLRVVVKMFFEMVNYNGKENNNIFIYGAKEAGVNIAKSLRVNLRNQYRLRGFIADEPELFNKVMMGVTVYPNDDTLFEHLEEKKVNTVIVSPAKMDALKNSEITDKLLAHNIRLLTSPPLSVWKGGAELSVQIKNIQIEDLLQRDPIQVDMREIASHIEGKRVLITGAAGSIGSEIMRQVAKFNPYNMILVDQAETPLHDVRLELQDNWRNLRACTIIADVSNESRMEKIFRDCKPQYIFHAAAYKHVPMMEDDVSESIQVNVKGTHILADLAVKYGVEKFVMVSTDKAVNPTNVMGCSKRLAEIYVQSLAKKLEKEGKPSVKFITTRFGNVLGSNGSVIPRFREQIDRGGPVTVTHPEIIRFFMTIPEACQLVLEAGCMGRGGEIYIFDMGKPVKIVDLAQRMISLSGRTDVKIEFTGLRRGEKLFEELLANEELTQKTHHEKIMIARVREYDYEDVKKGIDELIDLSYTYDPMAIVRKMKEIVPEFTSKNSKFECLDNKKEEVDPN